MSNRAYLQKCKWCGKSIKSAVKLKYCSDQCREDAMELKSRMRLRHKDITIDDVLEIHRNGLDVEPPKKIEVEKDEDEKETTRNPFLKRDGKILFPVRYTSGAVRWEWSNPDNIEKGVRII